MRNIYYVLLVVYTLFFIRCTVAEQSKQKYLHVNPTVYLAIEEENQGDIEFLEQFFATKWEQKKFNNMLLQPLDVLHGIYDIYWEIIDYPYFKPTLLALQNVSDNKTIAKVAFTHPSEDEFSYVFAIYNFMIHEAEDGLKLSNIFEHQINDWKSTDVEGNTYYSKSSREFNFEDISKMNLFNIEMASYFKTNPIQFTYYACKDMEEAYSLRGYDYESSMYYNRGVGAFAYPGYRSIFSGNNSEFNSHEIVHLYTYDLFPNLHSKLDEGLAVYLGGALDLKFEEYIPKLKNYITHNEIDIFDYIFEEHEENITILKKPIEDLILAFVCYFTEKEYGKEVLFELLNSGRSNKELILALEETLGLNKRNFNIRIKQELTFYDEIN